MGLHWIALQSVAWTTMVIEYSKRAPLREAVAQTFDGAHPCSLCHAVAAGKKSEAGAAKIADTIKEPSESVLLSFGILS